MVNFLVGCTGSVATIKLDQIIDSLRTKFHNPQIKIILTEHAKKFVFLRDSIISYYDDEAEWVTWTKRGDDILHIKLRKWADVMVVAPLDCNTLAKISNGSCDNLLTNTIRAWNYKKPLVLCLAANTFMYQHPFTANQMQIMRNVGATFVPVHVKKLMCGDTGPGAMANISDITNHLERRILKDATVSGPANNMKLFSLVLVALLILCHTVFL